ncbi:transcriptional regulator [Frankia canadensis]|nr:transcriptional regulator [Frankia canadensis]
MSAQSLLQHPLTALRSALDLTAVKYLDRLDDAHHALGYGRMAKRREKVSRWETGVNDPDEPTRYAMARLHGIPPAAVTELGWPDFLLLAFPDDRPVLDTPWTPAGTVASVAATARGGSMDRRAFLISSGAALTGIAISWSDAVGAPLIPLNATGRRLDPDVMTRLENRLDDLRHLDDVLSGRELLPAATAEYRLLERIACNATYDSAVSRRLFSALAEASRICGWLHFDADQHAQAQRFYITSLRASASVGDTEVGANTMNFMAIQTYSIGNPQDAVNLVRTAQDRVTGSTTPRVRALLHARAGRALSKTGDLKGCAHEFNAARDAYAQGVRDDDPPWAYSITEGEIEMLAGSSALDLGDPRRALHSFTAAQQAEPGATMHLRDNLLYLTRSARAHLELGDLDAACAAATDAFHQNSSVNSSRPSDALDDIRDRLTPHRDVPAVRDFLSTSA